jgi:hypothetical protein
MNKETITNMQTLQAYQPVNASRVTSYRCPCCNEFLSEDMERVFCTNEDCTSISAAVGQPIGRKSVATTVRLLAQCCKEDEEVVPEEDYVVPGQDF